MSRSGRGGSPDRPSEQRFPGRVVELFRWPALSLLALTALGLGIVGFDEVYVARGLPRSGFDLFYLSFQLFFLESGAVLGSVPWELQVARLLAPAIAGYALLSGLAVLFQEQIDRYRMRLLRDHVLVCGLGRKGLVLTRFLLAAGHRVIVIERNAENDRIVACRGDSALVLIGDARSARCLRSAGIDRAQHLVAISEDDGSNAEISVQARNLAANRRGSTLGCVIQIVDPRLCALLRLEELQRPPDPSFRLDFFNVFETGATHLLDDHPVTSPTADASTKDAHIVVAGVGRFGTALIVEAAKRWHATHARGEGTLRITLVDHVAGAKARALRLYQPLLDRTCELVPLDYDLRSPEFFKADFMSGGEAGAVTGAYVCIDDDSLSLSAGLVLHGRLKKDGVPVVVRMVHDVGLASLLRSSDDSFPTLHPFGLLDRTCNAELVLGGTYELLARAMHAEYLRDQRSKGDTSDTNPALVSWDQLPQALKDSNRQQASHIGVKLREIGCELETLTDWEAKAAEFSDEEVEHLAKIEHERWEKERRRVGWTLAPVKNVDRKETPFLIPWAELSEDAKDRDRLFIRGLPSFLANIGLLVVRLSRTR